LAWTIEYDADAVRSLKRMNPTEAKRVIAYMSQVGDMENPRSKGHGLTGQLHGLWRFRCGDWRIICDIQDAKLIIVALAVGHRSRIYK
jgi:mRNA interferase RelE/StbE